MNLTETLRKIPNSAFFKPQKKGQRRKADYNAVLAYVLRKTNTDNPKLEVLCRRLETGVSVNISSFQRSVALEAKRRIGATKKSR